LIQLCLKPGLGSLNVIGTDSDRSDTYDFLLTFHSKKWPISYRFRDKWRFRSKIEMFFPTPCIVYFVPPLKGFPWNWVPAYGVKKTRMMGLPGRTRRFTISSAVWMQSTNVTDGQTPGDSKDRAYA